jgi:hypothetical protein
MLAPHNPDTVFSPVLKIARLTQNLKKLTSMEANAKCERPTEIDPELPFHHMQ